MKEYDVYLFDFDGTLFDTAESLIEVYRVGFNAVGIPMRDDEPAIFMHTSLKETAEMKNVPLDKYNLFYTSIMTAIDTPECIAPIRVFEETSEVLDILKGKGKILGVVSGNSSDHIKHVLDHFSFVNPFKAIVGSNDVSRGKPNPDPIDKCLELLGITDRSKCVYIGDSMQDIACAKAAGVDVFLVDRTGIYKDFNGKKIKNLRDILPRRTLTLD